MGSDPRISFGLRVVALRKAKGWSQLTLEVESGIARSYIGGVEKGRRNIGLINICRLAKALGVPPSKLMEF